MVDKFNEAVEEFISLRINDFGETENEKLTALAKELKINTDRLIETFNSEQLKIWQNYETAYALHDGETLNFYYRASFADAINFILKMKRVEG